MRVFTEGKNMLCGGSRLSLPLGEGGTVRRRAVTDEGSPPMASLTAARAFAILWLAAVAASAPSEEGAVAVKSD